MPERFNQALPFSGHTHFVVGRHDGSILASRHVKLRNKVVSSDQPPDGETCDGSVPQVARLMALAIQFEEMFPDQGNGAKRTELRAALEPQAIVCSVGEALEKAIERFPHFIPLDDQHSRILLPQSSSVRQI
jgi:hypothetical protein